MTGRPWIWGVLVLGGALAVSPAGCTRDAAERRLSVWTEPLTGMEFVRLPAGRFVMGTPPEEPLREAQEVSHGVRLSRPFYLGRYEVTQGQWQRVMGSNPSTFAGCAECPVEGVSYNGVQAFITRLEALGGPRLRLPTEAEWEYGCRAGTTTAFAWGGALAPDAANFDGSQPYGAVPSGPVPRGTLPVGSFAPNAWGLHDLHGNVWEWTEDEHCPYGRQEQVDPLGRCDSPMMVIRGGGWAYGADSARCGLRHVHRPQDVGPGLGFRLARDGE